MNNNNNNDPIVLGELKKEKSSKPIFVLLVFIILIGICLGLPEIKNYLNTENNKITEIYNNTIGKIIDNIMGDSESPTPSNIQTKEDELGLTKLDINTVITFNEIRLSKVTLKDDKITYSLMTTDNSQFDVSEKNYYLVVYGSNQNILTKLKLIGNVSSEEVEITGTFSDLKTVSNKTYFGKIIELQTNEFDTINLNNNTLTCTQENTKYLYIFNEQKLIKINEEYKYIKTDQTEEYTTKWNYYNLKSNTISMHSPSTSSITQDETSFTFNATLELNALNIDELGDYKDENYYSLNTELKKIYTEMKSKGYTCS